MNDKEKLRKAFKLRGGFESSYYYGSMNDEEKLEAIIEVIKVRDADDQYELADTREKLESNMMKKTNIIEEIKKILS